MKHLIQQRHYLPFPACFRAEKGYTININEAKAYEAHEIPDQLEHMERVISLDEIKTARPVKMLVVHQHDLPEVQETA